MTTPAPAHACPQSNCGSCAYFTINGFITCAVHPLGPQQSPCPDWVDKTVSRAHAASSGAVKTD